MCHGAICRLITVIGKTLTDVFAAGTTIDATFVKVHLHVLGACGGKQGMGLNTKIYAAVDANGIPVKFTVTNGTFADCSQACELINGMTVDRGYDTDKIITELGRAGEKIKKSST